TGTKILIALAFIAVIVVATSYSLSLTPPPSLSPQSNQQSTGYPQTVSPQFYTNPSVSSDGTKAAVPADFVTTNKMAFIDLKLESPTPTLTYQGRTVPLEYYKGGNYLPLITFQSPSGKMFTGIRVCEPCGSFSFHIVQGKYLECDVCGTRWNLDNFADSSGGCTTYPPPEVSSTVGENVEIDLSSIQLKIAA
ncbi:MAG TPA: Fe-S-containing protein, partial [Candidatus Bathyarchaeia archaeon]